MTESALGRESPRNVEPQADLESVFSRHQNELLGTLYYLLGNWEDARECYQETFLKCWRAPEQCNGVVNLKAWVFRVAINAGRDMRGSAWRSKRRAFNDEADTLPGREDSPSGIAEESERMRMLREAIAALRIEEKEVFLLRQNGDLTYDQIAELLNIPSGTVKTRMRAAIQKLRETLDG